MQNKNSSTTQQIRDVARSQDAVEVLPSSFSSNIQLVAEVNPKLLRRAMVSGNLFSAALPAVPGKKYVITAAIIAYTKDAVATGSNVQINVVLNGATRAIARLLPLATTAESREIHMPFNCYIECDANTSVAVASTGSFGNSVAIVHYYLIDE